MLELVHNDICDLNNTIIKGGKNYFVTFIDDYSRCCDIYMLHSKKEVLEKFKIYKFKVELHSGAFTENFRINREGEYYDSSYFESIE